MRHTHISHALAAGAPLEFFAPMDRVGRDVKKRVCLRERKEVSWVLKMYMRGNDRQLMQIEQLGGLRGHNEVLWDIRSKVCTLAIRAIARRPIGIALVLFVLVRRVFFHSWPLIPRELLLQIR